MFNRWKCNTCNNNGSGLGLDGDNDDCINCVRNSNYAPIIPAYIKSNRKIIDVKRDKLITHCVDGMNHPLLGKKITAMYLCDEGLQIMCDGNVFIITGGKTIQQICGDDK